jgi:hypothetical protein
VRRVIVHAHARQAAHQRQLVPAGVGVDILRSIASLAPDRQEIRRGLWDSTRKPRAGSSNEGFQVERPE